MTSLEIKLARRLAKSDADLSKYDDAPLFGFGLPDFGKVEVPLGAVAKCMRWQCCQFNGGWDSKQDIADARLYRHRVTISDISSDEMRDWIVGQYQQVLAEESGVVA